MTSTRSGPDTAALARDARQTHAPHSGDVKPSAMALGVIIGRASEAFDFLVYAIASIVVFPRHVFPFVDALTGTLYSFGLFSLAFLARPLGTAMFAVLDRTYGRGAKLGAALLLLGTSTVTIALLPGYRDIGTASIWILALSRAGQGLALGGSWDGLPSLLAVNAPANRRGFYAMVPQLGAPIGVFVASALFACLIGRLSAAEFLEWGWRYPFFVAFASNVVALFARLRIVATPQYAQLFATQELQPSPIVETIRASGRTIVIGAFVPLASLALFHIVTVFPLSWVFLFTPEHARRLLWIQAIGSALGMTASLASGWLADRLGRRRLLASTAMAIAAFSVVAPQLLIAGDPAELVFMCAGFVLLGVSFGQASGAVATGFPIEHRYTGSALTSDLAWLFGVGFAPWVALALSSRFGVAFAGVYLLSGALITSVALLVNRRLAQGR